MKALRWSQLSQASQKVQEKCYAGVGGKSYWQKKFRKIITQPVILPTSQKLVQTRYKCCTEL